MPEPGRPRSTRVRRVGIGVAAAALAAATVALPAAAQESGDGTPKGLMPVRWGDTTFEEPFDEYPVTSLQDEVTFGGVLRYDRQVPGDQITGATISVVDDTEDDFVPADGCDIPPVVDLPSSQGGTAEHAELPFDETLELECNGRWLIEIRARGGDDDPVTIRRALVLEALPPAVDGTTATLDAETDQVVVRWEPLAGDALAPDIVGYVVERAGPIDGSGRPFEDLAQVDLFDEPTIVDELPGPGTYSYRVRAAKNGPNGATRSNLLRTESAEVTKEPPPTTTTTTTAATTTTAGPRIGSAIPTTRPRSRPQLSPPTTVDTGFEDRLDYSNLIPTTRDRVTISVPGSLADEELGSASVIQDEGEETNLLIPAAGALVLLGWAGHIAYLNRLAKDL